MWVETGIEFIVDHDISKASHVGRHQCWYVPRPPCLISFIGSGSTDDIVTVDEHTITGLSDYLDTVEAHGNSRSLAYWGLGVHQKSHDANSASWRELGVCRSRPLRWLVTGTCCKLQK